MGLERHGFGRDLLVDEVGEAFHYIALDLFEQAVEVALVSLREPVRVGQDLLREGLRLLREIALELFETLAQVRNFEAKHLNKISCNELQFQYHCV